VITERKAIWEFHVHGGTPLGAAEQHRVGGREGSPTVLHIQLLWSGMAGSGQVKKQGGRLPINIQRGYYMYTVLLIE
jgi:hypothetical protein